MVRSMTGFGRSVKQITHGRVTVEIRAVNHRFSDVSVKLPKQWSFMEEKVRRWAASDVLRGKVEVSVHLESEDSSGEVHINWPLLKQFQKKFDELKEATGSSEDFPAAALLQHSDIVYMKQPEADSELLAEELCTCVTDAARELKNMRRMEGKLLKQDLQQKMDRLRELKEKISMEAPLTKKIVYERLRQRAEEFLSGVEVDESRLLTEVAVHVEKADIEEELIRIESHIRQFSNTLEAEGAVGRKLDFLLQELNREVNTIGSKAAAAETGTLAVEMKDEIEKLREQVQNIE
ncbi:MAG: YicC family protein [Alkalicoccus sp.]|nr:MAG: YicC family protein [Alkalicoccus sp.]